MLQLKIHCRERFCVIVHVPFTLDANLLDRWEVSKQLLMHNVA